MDWNNNNTKNLRNNSNSSFVSHPLDSNFLLHHSNHFGHFPGMEGVNHHQGDPVHVHEMMMASNMTIIPPPSMEKRDDDDEMMTIMRYGGKNKEKLKRRLSSKQLESLESSFEEERKLDPDRKMKLAKEVGLQPRQVAVWFQNRRARWKAKKLEHLYDALKLEFEVVSKEKQMLQHEVQVLKSMLMEQQGGTKKQVNSGNNNNTEASCEETVESTATAADHNSHMNNNNAITSVEAILSSQNSKVMNNHYLFNNVDVCYDNNNTTSSPSYWGALA